MAILFDVGSNTASESENEKIAKEEVNIILDVTQFAGITSSELLEMLGKPDQILDDDDNGLSSEMPIPGQYYTYNNILRL